MPPGLERFSRFKDLPYDVRHKIWQEIIYTPGIHFLKFERNHVPRVSVHEEFSDDEFELSEAHSPRRPEPGKAQSRTSKKKYTATLKPIFPLPAADLSYYTSKTKTLAQLSFSCNEASNEVYRVVTKPDNLTLDNGRLIAFAKSSDIICIDYPDLLSTRRLSSWAECLNTSQLRKIRRLAVRYQPEWDEERRFCRVCGQYHEIYPGSRKEQAPRRHLYEFAALFPNLESFYFIDHLIVRQSSELTDDEQADPRWLGPSDRARVMEELSARGSGRGKPQQSEKFESGGIGGRTYFEIDRNLCKVCKVHSHVFNMLEWVQANYIAYCEKRGPKKHKHPQVVRFAVLACEWKHERLVADKIPQKSSMIPRKVWKMKNRKHSRQRVQNDLELIDAMNALKLESVCRNFDAPSSLPVIFGDEGVSAYEFTFTKTA
ncbi:hypothetical protein TruAng_000118 [Truncatella angustata]|nr:hypothetical protein TruAng_000118 [Truncatella angustata]